MSRSFPPERNLDELVARGWTSWDDALDPRLVAQLAEHSLSLHAQGLFDRAGIGRAERHQIREDIRVDQIAWWQPEQLNAAQSAFTELLEQLRLTLNRELFLGLQDFELHYAVYEPGAFYRRHLDRFRNQGTRAISLVFFLNPAWHLEHGGQLRLHLDTGTHDLLPQANRIVLFRADQIAHEVVVTQRTRLSIACWFKQRSGAINIGG